MLSFKIGIAADLRLIILANSSKLCIMRQQVFVNIIPIQSTVDFENTVMNIVENYPKQSLDVTMNLIDSHDTARALTALRIPFLPLRQSISKSPCLSK